MFTDYSHKQLKSEYTKDELQDEAEKRGLSTSGTKEELAERIKEHDAEADTDSDNEDTKEFMFPHAEGGPVTIEAESREQARQLLDNNNQDND